ncbi:MAG: PD-(D/E)XK motif protein [Bacteroidota bacterium]
MSPAELLARYRSLQPGEAEDRLSAVPLPGLRHRIARAASGGPVLLVAVQPSDSAPPPPLVLEHLTVQHDVLCRVVAPDGTEETVTLTVVRCTSPELGEHFLRVLHPIVEAVGPEPTRRDAVGAVRRLAELFQALQAPPRQSAQALFAELLVIASSRDPVALTRAWHVEPEDRFDFSGGPERIEVKSTSGETRRHHFSLEQVRPEADVQVLVVSVRVVRAADGLTLGALLDRVRGLLAGDTDLLLRVDHVVAQSLGGSLRRALRERFDEEVARASLRLYQAEDMPAVDPDLPPGVSGVRFTSELDLVQPLGCAEIGEEGLHSIAAGCVA